MKVFKYIFLCLFFITIAQAQTQERASLWLAGGCFWCMEPPYDELKEKGVLETTVGYAGGKEKDPTYEDVSSGKTGHIEAIEIVYQPDKVSLEKLLSVFWKNIDPLDKGGQFCDRGRHYRAAIFFQNEEQEQAYRKSLAKIKKELALGEDSKKDIAVLEFKEAKFYKAEEYHQDYYLKNPIRYKYYRYRCGRDERLEKVWGKDR